MTQDGKSNTAGALLAQHVIPEHWELAADELPAGKQRFAHAALLTNGAADDDNMAGRSSNSHVLAIEVYQDDVMSTPASTGATARPPKTSVLRDSTNTVHTQYQEYAYPKQGLSCTEQVLRARYPGAFVSEPLTCQLAAATAAGKHKIDVAALKARHPGAFLSETDTPEVRVPRYASTEGTDTPRLTAPLPGAFMSEREHIAQPKAAHNAGGTGSISYNQTHKADAPPFVPHQAAKTGFAIDSKYSNEGQTNGSHAVPTSLAPSSWILPEDPFGPTPVKGKQAAPPTGCSHLGLAPFAAELCPTRQLPARRSLPFNPPSSNYTPAFDLGCGPLINTSQGIVLNPAFKAAASSGVAANAPFLQHYAAASAAHLPVHAAPTGAAGYNNRPLESSDRHSSHVPKLHGSCPESRRQYHSASVTSLSTASLLSMEPVYNIPADRAPGYPTLPLNAPSEPNAVPRDAMTSPWAGVLASSADIAADNHHSLPPMIPQKIASYCHVKHSRKEMPDLPKETVKSLVQAQLQAGKPMRTAWYRDAPRGSRLSKAQAAMAGRMSSGHVSGSPMNVPLQARQSLMM
ncbi:TPA: hypothetical protein ACH3X2_003953 [Trebouxia sp. C0005]